ncbi:hypothetical protein HYV73_02535 [Candidatus Uhrbacteria bacterium]|nr:hypothetical protein [Candidatus Uhrbacteria bacterium]
MYSAQEILYIVLAFCALWLTAATFWLLYQTAAILRNVNETFTQLQEAIEKMEAAVSAIRNKVESVSGTVPLLMTGIKKIIDFAVEKRKSSKDDIL